MPSKRQTLLDYLVASDGPLKAITVANGHAVAVALVERGQRDINDLTDGDFPCLFIAGTEENRVNITKTQYNAELMVEVVGAVKSTTGVSGAQAQLDVLIASVTKVLETDHTQGGKVHTTMVRRIITDPGDMESHAACLVQVIFKYATEGTNP